MMRRYFLKMANGKEMTLAMLSMTEASMEFDSKEAFFVDTLTQLWGHLGEIASDDVCVDYW